MRSLVLCLFVLAGCSQTYTPPAGYLPGSMSAPEQTAHGPARMIGQEFCRVPWPESDQPLRLRQTVVWEAQDQTQVMQGMMQLDRQNGQARLVGLSELGMKLFDLTVDRQGHEAHALSPALGASRSALASQIARSVRRIFLPLTRLDTARTYIGPDSVLLVQDAGRETTVLACPERGGLVEHGFGPGQGWEMDFMEYQYVSGVLLPTRIEYQDHRRGYRLIMLMHKAGAQ